MSTKVSALVSAARELSEEERTELVDSLLIEWDSQLAEVEDAEFEGELLRRMDESDRDPSCRIPWDKALEIG